MSLELNASVERFIKTHRVAHLASADSQGVPHVVPICYAFNGSDIFMALDKKPKRIKVGELKRVKNIGENPNVCLVIDDYEEDWERLAFVMISGKATMVQVDALHSEAVKLLTAKYPQYISMGIDNCPIVQISLEKVVSWRGAQKNNII